jgi:hypothetical protein
MVQMIVVALNLCDNLIFMGLSRGGWSELTVSLFCIGVLAED